MTTKSTGGSPISGDDHICESSAPERASTEKQHVVKFRARFLYLSPLVGGLYQGARRLWKGQYAWILSWIYLSGVVVGCTTTVMFSTDFVVALTRSHSDIASTPIEELVIATAVWIALIGFLIVAAAGLACMWIAKPYQRSHAPESDEIAIADILRTHRAQQDVADSEAPVVPQAL